MTHTPMSVEALEQMAATIRCDIIDMICTAGAGHPGGSLSATDVVTALYFRVMRLDPQNPAWPDRDRFILSKGHASRLRATRDLRSFLSDRIKAPVVTADELGAQYLLRKRDIARTAAYLARVLLLYFLLFSHQEPILALLSQSGWYAETFKDILSSRFAWVPRILVSVAVFLFVPIVAYAYGTVTKTFLKVLKIE